MKAINKLLIPAAAVAAMCLSSCDEVGPNDRYIAMPAVEAKRVVLLEEYTGQKCVNCPEAHAVINSLMGQYPDNLIVVGLHSGGNAFSFGEGQYPSVVGLRNDDSEAYANEAGVNRFPSGVVNRRTDVQGMDLWGASIRAELDRASSLDMELTAALTADGSAIDITAVLDPHANLNGHLQLWVVESGITAPQIQPDGSMDREYVHNHVFRAAVNGHDGEPVSLVIREPQTFGRSIAVKENWNPSNLSVVAFVYTPSGVEQAAEAHVTPPAN